MATDLRGTADAPNFVRLDEPSGFRICAGTWFARLEIAADVDISRASTTMGCSRLPIYSSADLRQA